MEQKGADHLERWPTPGLPAPPPADRDHSPLSRENGRAAIAMIKQYVIHADKRWLSPFCLFSSTAVLADKIAMRVGSTGSGQLGIAGPVYIHDPNLPSRRVDQLLAVGGPNHGLFGNSTGI